MKKKIVLLFIINFLYACGDCEKSSQSYKKDNLEVVLTEEPFILGEMNFVGTKLNSDRITTTKVMGRWYRHYIEYMEVGDTIIKREQELILYIHKKDTTMLVKWECEGQVYE